MDFNYKNTTHMPFKLIDRDVDLSDFDADPDPDPDPDFQKWIPDPDADPDNNFVLPCIQLPGAACRLALAAPAAKCVEPGATDQQLGHRGAGRPLRNGADPADPHRWPERPQSGRAPSVRGLYSATPA